MAPGVNICALSLGLAAFAGWTLSRFPVPRRVGWFNLFGGVGILALIISVISPDDRFQQELIRPATPSGRVSANTRVAPQRSSAHLSINVFAVDPIAVLRTTSRSLVMDQSLELDTCSHVPFE